MTPFLMRLFGILLFMVTTAVAQPALEMQDTLNWGTVVPDVPMGETAKVTARVKLRNSGDALLRILEVRPGCGCTTAPIERDSLEPGEETYIDVALNLPLGNGQMHKTITIQSNDKAAPSRVLHLLVDVQRPFQLSSSFIPFNRGKVGDSIIGAISFVVSGDKPVEVRATSLQSNVEIVTPMPLIVQPNTTAEVRVAIVPKNVGPFEAMVRFTTTVSGYEKFELRGYGTADPAE